MGSDAVKLEFDSAAHRYTLNGRVVPSVTRIMEPLDLLDGIPLDKLEHARIRGQHVHEAMALLVRDELDWSSLDDELRPYIEGGKRFLDESGIVVVASEQRVACPTLRIAGTLDLYGYWRDAPCIIDWKATAALPPSVAPQCAAYDKLYTSTFKSKLTGWRKHYCVLLKPNDYKVYPLPSPTTSGAWSIFQSCLNIYNWRSKHAA